MTSEDNTVDEFRRITSAVMRAIAHRDDIDVTFAAEPPQLQGAAVRLPLPSYNLPQHEIDVLRGVADGLADPVLGV